MPGKRRSMRKITEVLRLKYAAGLRHEKVARAVGLSKGAVNRYVSLAEAQGLSWPLPEGMDEAALEARLYPPRSGVRSRVEPDYGVMHTERKRKGVTLQLLWAEYVAAVGERAYRYSQSCERYRRWVKRQKRSMRQTHRAGEKLFQKLPGSRRSLFERLDRPVLKALPEIPDELAAWRRCRAGLDYHVQVAGSAYSVPHSLAGQRLDVRLSDTGIAVFNRGKRVAAHPRSNTGQTCTVAEHMPKAHREHHQWSPQCRLDPQAGPRHPAAARCRGRRRRSRGRRCRAARACQPARCALLPLTRSPAIRNRRFPCCATPPKETLRGRKLTGMAEPFAQQLAQPQLHE